MSQGALIIRFKYVSGNKSLLPPEEKVLGVHIEGEKKFSMVKQWGEGDERLLPIYPQYANYNKVGERGSRKSHNKQK